MCQVGVCVNAEPGKGSTLPEFVSMAAPFLSGALRIRMGRCRVGVWPQGGAAALETTLKARFPNVSLVRN